MFLHKMVTKEQVIPVILEVCPFYKKQTEKHLAFYEEDLLYVFVPDLANNAIELDKDNKQREILLIFEVIEKLFVEGNDEVREIIEIGVLEDFRHIFGESYEKFSKYLKPNSLKFWKTVPARLLDKLPYPKSIL